MMNNDNITKGQEIKVSLKNGFYYKGAYLNQGEDFLKIKDFKGVGVLIRISEIVSIEGVTA